MSCVCLKETIVADLSTWRTPVHLRYLDSNSKNLMNSVEVEIVMPSINGQ